MQTLNIDDLDKYPSLTELFRECELTASELDYFMFFMDAGISQEICPIVMQMDMASLYGDALIRYTELAL